MVRERNVLSQLRSDARLGDLRALLPEELAWGRIGDQAFVVESALPGIDARGMLDDPRLSGRLESVALDVAAVLHERTSRTVTVDRDLTARWIEEPLREIVRLRGAYPRIAMHERTLEELAQKMTEAFLGRRMVISWLHGDFFPGNILVSPDATTVTGLVDWD